MAKRNHSFSRNLMSAAVVVLTLTMLLLAGIYISGVIVSSDSAAITYSEIPGGAATVGDTPAKVAEVYEKGLLQISSAAIRFSGNGGGAYGSEAAAKALLEFALEPVHTCLSGDAVLSGISEEEFASATLGDYLLLDLISPLPYQMIYALSGEYSSAAKSEDAVSADRLLLAFPSLSSAQLYLSDGESFYKSSIETDILYFELYALANDSRLGTAYIDTLGVPYSDASPILSPITVASPSSPTDSMTSAEREKVLSLLGFNPESASEVNAVSPHGTLRITPTNIVFIASLDSGINVSSFLETAKEALDISIYDILLGSVELCERIRGDLPRLSGGDLYLKGFYREGDAYTVVIGLASESVAVGGDGYPHFARLTVQGGRFTDIRISLLQIEKGSSSDLLFPSSWQYSHASDGTELRTLRLMYKVSLAPQGEIKPVWCFTEVSE